jgi:hypothetical protein
MVRRLKSLNLIFVLSAPAEGGGGCGSIHPPLFCRLVKSKEQEKALSHDGTVCVQVVGDVR